MQVTAEGQAAKMHEANGNLHHEVHEHVLHVMKAVLRHVDAVEGVLLYSNMQANIVKVSTKNLKLNPFGEDVCWIKLSLNLLQLNDSRLDQILKVQKPKLNVSGPSSSPKS